MDEGKSLGVWSTRSKSWIGSGVTKRKTISKRLWLVHELSDGRYRCTPLTSNMVASGSDRIVQPADFHNDYSHEPEFVSGLGQPQKLSADKVVVKGSGEDLATNISEALQEAEPTVKKKLTARELEEKEHEVRADFGMGLTYLKMGKVEQAKEIFDELPDKDIPWEPEHKHMFSDFGTGLRKTKLHDSALKHYLKAIELSPEDEHLCHNLARVYYEVGRLDECRKWLVRSLELNPELGPSQQFLRFLDKQGASPKT